MIAPGDPSSIRRAIECYLVDRRLLAAHRARSRALVQSMSWRTVAESLFELYQTLADDCPRRRVEALAARKGAFPARRPANPP